MDPVVQALILLYTFIDLQGLSVTIDLFESCLETDSCENIGIPKNKLFLIKKAWFIHKENFFSGSSLNTATSQTSLSTGSEENSNQLNVSRKIKKIIFFISSINFLILNFSSNFERPAC